MLLLASEIEETSWIYANKDHPLLCFRVHAKGKGCPKTNVKNKAILSCFHHRIARRKWELLLRVGRPAFLCYVLELFTIISCQKSKVKRSTCSFSLFSMNRFTLNHACMNLHGICYHWSVRFVLLQFMEIVLSRYQLRYRVHGSCLQTKKIHPPAPTTTTTKKKLEL